MIDRLQGFFGFTRTPSAVQTGLMMFVCRPFDCSVRFCVRHRSQIRVQTIGRMGRAIYLPNPTVGVRGIHHQIVAALGARPLTHHATARVRGSPISNG